MSLSFTAVTSVTVIGRRLHTTYTALTPVVMVTNKTDMKMDEKARAGNRCDRVIHEVITLVEPFLPPNVDIYH